MILNAIASCAGIAVSLATFRYFYRRRDWFVPHDSSSVTGQQCGLAALAAGIFLLLAKLFPPGL